MKNTLLFFLRHFLFCLLLFFFFRCLFILSETPWNSGASLIQTFQTLTSGYRLDLATASYLAIIPFLLCVFLILGTDKVYIKAIKIYYLVIIVLVILMSLANIIIYKYWGTLLNNRGLTYALQPAEMFASVTNTQLFLIFISITILIIFFVFVYNKLLQPSLSRINGTTSERMISLLIVMPFIGIGIRGGLQLIPINESSAYFSNQRTLNNIAINNIWYLGNNLQQSGISEENPYRWMTDDVALKIKNDLLVKSEKRLQIFNTAIKPNIVLLLLESWTADIIEPLGGVKGVTPFFTTLSSKGLLFSSVYSSGFRTDQALVSVISGFPAQPNKSIIKFPAKTVSLPSIATILKSQGYKTSFFYGGELGFANMNSYLLSAGFEKITGKSAFPDNSFNSKWGAHDGFVLNYQLDELNKSQQPFFSMLLTLSTHEPFEVPVVTPYSGTDEPELFKKAAWYTDKSLREYFEKAQSQPWFANTIFILVADHGHRLPLNRDYYDPKIRKIPLLIYSPLLKHEYIGKQLNQTGNQNDIAATLLNSLGLESNSFEWSNDLLNDNRKNYAYLSLDEAFTWVTDTGSTTIKFDHKSAADGQGANDAKAYLQLLYNRFLSY